jgi:type IV secretory pathway TrbF-like protein
MRFTKSKPKGDAKVEQAFEEDMPDAAFAAARNEFFQSTGSTVVANGRLFLINVFLLLIVIILSITLYSVYPLKTTEPYVISVDGARGVVAKSTGEVQRAVDYTPDRPVLEREIYSFVDRLYAINADYPKIVRDGHVAAYSYSRGRAITEFKAFMDAEQPYQRQAKTKGLIRTTEKKTISFREDGKLVLIRFRTNERSTDQPIPIARDWVMTLQFAREQPTAKEVLDVNPLGLYVTHFEIVEER